MPSRPAPPDQPTDAPPRPPWARSWAITVIGVAVLAVLIAGVGAARRSSPPPDTRPVADRDPTTSTAPTAVRFAVTGIDANHTAPPSDEVVRAVISQLDTWANDGLVGPLRAGTAAPALEELFTSSARAAATSTDRSTLTVEGVPPSRVTITAATAKLTTVAGPDAGVAVVVASIDVQLVAEGDGHEVAVVRQGDIVLVPEPDGVWRIDGWRLHAGEQSTP